MPEVSEETLKVLIKTQRESEARTQERLDGFATALGSLAQLDATQGLVPSTASIDALAALSLQQRISDLEERLEELEARAIMDQLPKAYRYRNDGAEGVGEDIHRDEWIPKASPYSDHPTDTIFWPDDEWIPIPGSDAVVQS